LCCGQQVVLLQRISQLLVRQNAVVEHLVPNGSSQPLKLIINRKYIIIS
jgi:hypothetical protein